MDTALDALLKSQPGLWRGRDRYNDEASVATGFSALDAALPAGGWPIGGVTELMSVRAGIGEVSLLLPGLRRVTTDEGQWAAFINPPFVPYAPALANAGVRLDRLLIVDGKSDDNALWAAEQVLRAGLFAAVVVWVTRASGPRLRRLQLAAEAGRTWATVYRPASAAGQPSPVTLRIVARLVGDRLSLELLKVRGGQPGTLTIEPMEFDAPQGAEWPGLRVPAPPAESVRDNVIGGLWS